MKKKMHPFTHGGLTKLGIQRHKDGNRLGFGTRHKLVRDFVTADGVIAKPGETLWHNDYGMVRADAYGLVWDDNDVFTGRPVSECYRDGSRTQFAELYVEVEAYDAQGRAD